MVHFSQPDGATWKCTVFHTPPVQKHSSRPLLHPLTTLLMISCIGQHKPTSSKCRSGASRLVHVHVLASLLLSSHCSTRSMYDLLVGVGWSGRTTLHIHCSKRFKYSGIYNMNIKYVSLPGVTPLMVLFSPL